MGCIGSRALQLDKTKDPVKVPINGFDEVHSIKPLSAKVPLSVREMFRLKSSWKAIHRELEPTGIQVLVTLFRENKQLMNLFSKFSSMDYSDIIRESDVLATHGGLVMGVWDECILCIDNYDKMKSVLNNTAATHTVINAFSAQLFWTMETPFLEAIKQTLGDRYSDQMADIYKRAIHFVLEELEDSFKAFDSSDSHSNDFSNNVAT